MGLRDKDKISKISEPTSCIRVTENNVTAVTVQHTCVCSIDIHNDVLQFI